MRFSLIVLATLLVGFTAAAPVLQSDIFKGTQKAERGHKLVPHVTVRECKHKCELEYGKYHIGPYELIACEKNCH
ncbi:BZ3500_MvSof-1268-A1-R1_Chr6-1g08392 [Microbotryum saponariae]|uniref:BZ3500_MvSof-1268-A1-R1_Chr6-1g08392 protein n=1 Tax=Microbotryum saponariae TaxID=289078 RepID=A0A2X0KMG0_9BASI|nr:BZ3500_MvSof-1268-A1-R1_Chr6-1g08392 [Microbotryum saponariae]SDA07676.1 BZ3501_MvSof-1269-A2-R1_Chr6-1g08113 [Microbotryum saponariae]